MLHGRPAAIILEPHARNDDIAPGAAHLNGRHLIARIRKVGARNGEGRALVGLPLRVERQQRAVVAREVAAVESEDGERHGRGERAARRRRHVPVRRAPRHEQSGCALAKEAAVAPREHLAHVIHKGHGARGARRSEVARAPHNAASVAAGRRAAVQHLRHGAAAAEGDALDAAIAAAREIVHGAAAHGRVRNDGHSRGAACDASVAGLAAANADGRPQAPVKEARERYVPRAR